jgi:hypothetical protein
MKTKPGTFYGQTHDGRLEELRGQGHQADVWICRRLCDFPGGRLPAGGELAQCERCEAVIVFNPARLLAVPRVCMQCAQIQPLPMAP